VHKQYKVIHVVDGFFGTLFFGTSGLPLGKLEDVLNEYGKEGWDLAFQVIEKKRMWLFWERESIVVTLVRSDFAIGLR
jgi:hypothetical protein